VTPSGIKNLQISNGKLQQNTLYAEVNCHHFQKTKKRSNGTDVLVVDTGNFASVRLKGSQHDVNGVLTERRIPPMTDRRLVNFPSRVGWNQYASMLLESPR
jgi:hypothetical protein